MSTHPMSHIDVDLWANGPPLDRGGNSRFAKLMDGLDQNPQVAIKPEEDARLPILEAQIESEWRQFRSGYVKRLQKTGQLQKQVREIALWCVQVLHDAEKRGLNPDQGRELIQPLIHPQFDRS